MLDSGSSRVAPSAEDGGELFDEDSAPEEAPATWEISGQIVLDSDVVVEDSSSLSVRLLSETRQVLCEANTVIETATAMDATQYPDEALLGWWRLFVEPSSSESCFSTTYTFPVPVPMMLGIGAMHPEILAAAGADESLGDISGLNGAYASMDGGDTVWVFGVIGTELAFEGGLDPEESAPLSDGKWLIEPVYSFPL